MGQLKQDNHSPDVQPALENSETLRLITQVFMGSPAGEKA